MNQMTKILAAAAFLAASIPSLASAKVQEYKFDFSTSYDHVTATGEFFVAANNEIVSISGAVDNTSLGPQKITGLIANGAYPGTSYSPDGLFYYDNAFSAKADPTLGLGGILFTTNGNSGYWNLWGTAQNSYTLYASANGGYPVQEFGHMSVSAVPETSTWLMMLTGFLGLGFVGYRKQRATQTA